MLTPLSVLRPATTIVADGSSFTISFVSALMSPMRWLSKKCNDFPQSEGMISFSGPELAESAMHEKPMPDRGELMVLCGVGAAWGVIGVAGAVTRGGGAVTGAGGVTGAGKAGAMIVVEDIPLVVTAVLPVRVRAATMTIYHGFCCRECCRCPRRRHANAVECGRRCLHKDQCCVSCTRRSLPRQSKTMIPPQTRAGI